MKNPIVNLVGLAPVGPRRFPSALWPELGRGKAVWAGRSKAVWGPR